MQPETVFPQLGLSLLLGLLVGLEREHAVSRTAGMRTFPLITLFGTVSAILARPFGGWIVASGVLGVAAVIVVAHLMKLRKPDPEMGTTTDAAMLLMFAVGALLTVDDAMPMAIAVGGGVAILLQFKPEMHRFARTLGDADLKAVMQFVLIACIVLPVLPDRTFGPLGVFNPRETWWMVVLIVGMSLGGYIVYKFLGRDAGILLGGVLGGAISSTATTVSYSRFARGGPEPARAAAIVVMIASTVVYARVLVEIAVVEFAEHAPDGSPSLLGATLGPIGVLMALTLLPALAMWLRARRTPAPIPVPGNPTQLKPAVMFGAMYVLVLFALAWAKSRFDQHGLYAVAALSGLTDMDAITLSTARMAMGDPRLAETGWQLIVVGSMANLVFKSIIAGILGGRRLLGQIAVLFAVPLAGATLMLALWPSG